MANVSRDTVHRWINRGLLTPIGRTPPGPGATRPGSARFTRGQVLELLRNPQQTDIEDYGPPTTPTLTTDLLGGTP